MYFSEEMFFKTLLIAKNRDKYALFLRKLFAHTSSYDRLKKGKTSTSYLSPSRHATYVVASNLRSPEFGCITSEEGVFLLQSFIYRALKHKMNFILNFILTSLHNRSCLGSHGVFPLIYPKPFEKVTVELQLSN